MSEYQHKVNELLQQRKGLHEQMKAIVDGAAAEKRSQTAEENATFDRLDTEINELDQQRKRLENLDKREADLKDLEERGGPPIVAADQTWNSPRSTDSDGRGPVSSISSPATCAISASIRASIRVCHSTRRNSSR